MDENKNVEKTKFGVRTTHPVMEPCYSVEHQVVERHPYLAAVFSIETPFA